MPSGEQVRFVARRNAANRYAGPCVVCEAEIEVDVPAGYHALIDCPEGCGARYEQRQTAAGPALECVARPAKAAE